MHAACSVVNPAYFSTTVYCRLSAFDVINNCKTNVAMSIKALTNRRVEKSTRHVQYTTGSNREKIMFLYRA